MLGIITGSGLYELEGLSLIEEIDVDTPYGKPSGKVLRCLCDGIELFFLPRHGQNHSIPPHVINYRANITALRDVGVDRVLSISAVGGIRDNLVPGDIIIGNQIIDFTKKRINSFFDTNDVVHVDFTFPYCQEMRKIMIDACSGVGIDIIDGGVYVAVEGPRLETAAEIQFFKSFGADIVGMTAMPEAALAREAEICYVGIYVVTNFAAGITGKKLTTQEVINTMEKSQAKIETMILHSLKNFHYKRLCSCKDALKDARL